MAGTNCFQVTFVFANAKGKEAQQQSEQACSSI
jgi:hypothetical protein